MEILINELSLKGQFTNVDEFVSVAVIPLLSLIQQVDSSRDVLLKKYDLYEYQVTPRETLHNIFKGTYSRTYDEIRKFKSQLSALLDKPYWQDDQKHNNTNSYLYKGKDILNTSLAESCERDKVVLSFKCDEYNILNLDVEKNSSHITIDNVFDGLHFYNLVRERKLVVVFLLTDTSRFKRTSLKRQGQLVYKELSTKYFWYLDNLHKDHYEVFNQKKEHIGTADKDGNIDSSKRVVGRAL